MIFSCRSATSNLEPIGPAFKSPVLIRSNQPFEAVEQAGSAATARQPPARWLW
jgi:hypothetical protein